MKTKITPYTLLTISACLIISCSTRELVEKPKFIVNDRIIKSGAAWFLARVQETGFDEKLKYLDSTFHITVSLIESSLTILKDDSIVLAGSYYQEFHRYLAEDDGYDFVVKYDPSAQRMPKHPKTGREMKLTERKEVYFYAAYDLDRGVIRSYYHKIFRIILFNTEGEMATEVESGDTLYVLNTTMIGPCVVTESKKKFTEDSEVLEFSMSDLELRPVPLYDFLDYHLKRINVANSGKKYDVTFTVSRNVTEEVVKNIKYTLEHRNIEKPDTITVVWDKEE